MYFFFINIEPQACVLNMGQRLLRGKIEMHRSQPLINFAWSLTTEQPVLRARSSQNVHLLTYPVKENIQDVI